MQCPKCHARMEKIVIQGGEVDRCTDCKGLWFDGHEHHELKAAANHIDTGSAEIGAEFNKVEKINCPACANSQMLRMVDAAQAHIWFESCPTCYGRFFDAGEFRDLSETTFSDFIKRFSVQQRN